MDIGNRFSLEDFLAYFFPGVAGALGIYVLLQMTPLQSQFENISPDLTVGIIFFVISYLVGIIFSGFSELVFSKVTSHKETMPLHDSIQIIFREAFQATFKIPKENANIWSRSHYYLCRSLVFERMPNILPTIQRQSSLRQLRINLLPSLVVWAIVSVVWGIQQIKANAIVEGIIIVVASVVLFIIIFTITVDRARSNERREVREVLTAFVVNYQTNDAENKNFTKKSKK